jgi:hypothetical protein
VATACFASDEAMRHVTIEFHYIGTLVSGSSDAMSSFQSSSDSFQRSYSIFVFFSSLKNYSGFSSERNRTSSIVLTEWNIIFSLT